MKTDDKPLNNITKVLVDILFIIFENKKQGEHFEINHPSCKINPRNKATTTTFVGSGWVTFLIKNKK